MITTSSWNLGLLCFGDGRPSGSTFDTLLSFEFTPFDLSDHKKVVKVRSLTQFKYRIVKRMSFGPMM